MCNRAKQEEVEAEENIIIIGYHCDDALMN